MITPSTILRDMQLLLVSSKMHNLSRSLYILEFPYSKQTFLHLFRLRSKITLCFVRHDYPHIYTNIVPGWNWVLNQSTWRADYLFILYFLTELLYFYVPPNGYQLLPTVFSLSCYIWVGLFFSFGPSFDYSPKKNKPKFSLWLDFFTFFWGVF